jgi:CheY-like chemotaxis protein
MPKILIADDSRFQVELIASYLRPKGFELVFAGDALQTWMTALRGQPSLVVLDINMPGGSGIEVLKRLRMSSKTQQIPVIVVSGNEDDDIEAAARNLAIADFLHKPVDEALLCNAVSKVLAPQAK